MSMLATQPRYLTADEFLAEYEGVPGKWELVGGVPHMMAGGTARHADVAGNIYAALRTKLPGTGCRPFNSDMGLRISEQEVLYPDVAVYCDPRDLECNPDRTRSFGFPSVIFEILSPSSVRRDRGRKLEAYRELDSVRLIVLVDAAERRFETYERVDDDEWAVGLHAPGATLDVLAPPFTITADEMFAVD